MIHSIYKNENQSFYRGIVLMTDAEEEKQYGRVKIKVWGIYPDDVKSKDLPWAWPETPGMVGGKYQSGWSSVPEVGSIVRVYFDYGDINSPIFCGTVPGLQHKPQGSDFDNTVAVYGKKNDKNVLDKEDKHEQDFHRLGMSEPSFDYDQKLDERWEPDEDSPEQFESEEKWNVSWKTQHANVKYPLNHVFSTGRHTLEYDNTDGYERVTLGHWVGSFLSLDWEGDMIFKSINNNWTVSDKNSIEWIKENKVSMSKNSVEMTNENVVRAIGGTAAFYFGREGESNYNYEGEDILGEVLLGDINSDSKAYYNFAGDLEYKLEKSWLIEVIEDVRLGVSGELHACISGKTVINTGSTFDIQSDGVMNLNAPLIKLNCGCPEVAECTETEDPLTGDSTTPDRKEQGETSKLEEQNEAFVSLINKEIGAKCKLLIGDVASES